MKLFTCLSLFSILFAFAAQADLYEADQAFKSRNQDDLIISKVSTTNFETILEKLENEKKKRGIYKLKYGKKVEFKEIKSKFFSKKSFDPQFCEIIAEKKLNNSDCFKELKSIIFESIEKPVVSYVYLNGDNNSYDYKKLYLIINERKDKKESLHLLLTIQEENENEWLNKFSTQEIIDFPSYFKTIKKITKNALVEFVGYSGLDYENQESLELVFNYFSNLREGKKVLMFGGTADGIGRGYSFYAQQTNPSFYLTGMVSKNAKKYDIIDANNQSVFVVDSFKNEAGKSTWELKEEVGDSSYTQSILQEACQVYQSTDLVVIGGGKQSLQEVYELLREADESKFDCDERKINLHLVLGLDPNAEKLQKAIDKGKKKVTHASFKIASILESYENEKLLNLTGAYADQVKVSLYQVENNQLKLIKCLHELGVTQGQINSEFEKASEILLPRN